MTARLFVDLYLICGLCMSKVVLQKYIADTGLCSRRQAEGLIRAGKVTVNGRPAELGMKADSTDEVAVNGKPLQARPAPLYIIVNKPVGYVCTNRRFKEEKSIFDLVPVSQRLFVAGRLDKESRGLVLLTNDGEAALRLTHPRFAHEKEYHVRMKSMDDQRAQDVMRSLRNGVDIGEGDGVVKPAKIKYLGDERFVVVLKQGKKRQLRRMFAQVHCHIIDLVRTRIGTLALGDLPSGKWRQLSGEEVKKLV